MKLNNGWLMVLLSVGLGVGQRADAVSATGGTVTHYVENGTNYTVHTFTTVGTASLTVGAGGGVDVLVVGGGGGGGSGGPSRDADNGGGGGGAGGLIFEQNFAVLPGNSYTVTVGGGGTGGSGDGSAASSGGNSGFSSLTATGGGQGACAQTAHAAAGGGSGGGGSWDQSVGGTGTAGQGNNGGSAGGTRYPGGGGGGAGSAGLSGGQYGNSMAGGDGVNNSISGASVAYAGGGASGGGGWWCDGSAAGPWGGGSGGGSDGDNNGPWGRGGPAGNGAGGAGTANKGGGGGGGSCGDGSDGRPVGGNGGSGIVIVRYPTDTAQPQVANGGAQNVTDSAAGIAGTLTANGSSTATVYLYWGTNDCATSAANWVANGGVATLGAYADGTTFTNTLSGLHPSTLYYFNHMASNATGVAWGNIVGSPSFRTMGVPAVDNGVGANHVRDVAAMLNGNLTAGGTAHVYFLWGTDSDNLANTNDLGVLTQGAAPSVKLTGLAMETTYHYRTYATNAYGEALAPMTSFTTAAHMPWTTTSSGAWSDFATWGGDGVPDAGDDAIITLGHSVTVAASTANLNSLTDNGMLVLQNWDTQLRAVTATINGTVSCAGPFANGDMSNRVYIVCTDLTVAAGGKIDVLGKGYRGGIPNFGAGQGPGGGYGSDPAAGGGHGGYGGRDSGNGHAFGGGIYDSASSPLLAGSGGGDAYDHIGGTAGGGAVRIDAAGCVTVNGSILAAGQADDFDGNLYGRRGTGSGGSVYITCRTLAGTTGLISADGGAALCIGQLGQGSGGGGRIAVHNDSAAQALLPVPGVQFSANCGRRNDYETARGGIGSIYLTDARLLTDGLANVLNGRIESPLAITNSSLTVANRWLGFADGVRAVVTGDVRVDGAYSKLELGGQILAWYGGVSYRLDAPGGSTLTVGGNLALTNSAQLRVFSGITEVPTNMPGSLLAVGGDFAVGPGATVLVYSHPANGASPEFRADNVVLAAGALVDARGWGYAPAAHVYGSSGSGNEWWGWGEGNGYGGGGAGYGGAGFAYSGQGGVTYGDAKAPALPGSGGGSGNAGWGGGGGGGGLIRMFVAHQITLQTGSALRADGMAYGDMTPNGDRVGGGGSGGGIYLRCRGFRSESGVTISAPGGNSALGNGGGGGGGRIAIWRVKDTSSAAPTTDVAGGLAYSAGVLAPANNGLPGTVVWGYIPAPGLLISLR